RWRARGLRAARGATGSRPTPSHAARAGMHEELAVAVGAGDGRFHRAHDARAAEVEGGAYLFDDPGVDGRILDDAAAAGRLDSAGLELRLDEGDDVCAFDRAGQQRRCD